MDIYYIIFVVPAMLISLWAQFKVKSTFSKYSQVLNSKGVSGAQMAAYILKQNNIADVQIGHISGSLTDHYSPSEKVLRLSEPVFDKTSVAAVGVAAHEVGHAIQHATSYGPLVLRSTLVPVANLGSSAGPILAIAGIAAGLNILFYAGLILFGGAVAFYLITLPVEFNASIRAVKIMEGANIFSSEELSGIKKVLTAAALTYVASALTAIGNLLRLLFIARNRNNRR